MGLGTAMVTTAAVTTAGLAVVVNLPEHVRITDDPNERSSHTAPAVRGLGLACIAGWLVALVALDDVPPWGFVAGVVLIATVGLLDDALGGLSPAVRLPLTFAGGVVVAWAVVDAAGAWWAWIPLGAVWVAYFTNAFNFMDGIDGISATTVVVAGLAYAVCADRLGVSWLSDAAVLLAVAAVVFSVLNVLAAGRFLGDAGSYFFGAAVAGLALAVFAEGGAATAAAGPALLYVVDTLIAIGAKLRAGEGLFEAHRRHVYQRLVDAGWPHAASSLAVLAAGGACAVIGVVTLDWSTAGQVAGAVVMVVVMAGYLALPVLVSRAGAGHVAGAGDG